jgi:tRNA pseudouridine55 synthase
LDFPVFNKINPPNQEFDYAQGAVFLIDKPLGWTSFRPVGLFRKLTGIKKIGHAGTLDPMATGLLILCVGKATKSVTHFQEKPKEYVAEIQLGAATPSYDAETEISESSGFLHVDEELIQQALKEHFTGEIMQTVPMYSAIKHKGKRLYQLARKGIEVKREPRKITIQNISLDGYDPETGKIVVTINCSKGTYIRSIANDLGLILGTHGHLTALRRTKTGEYLVDDALEISKLPEYFPRYGDLNLS